MAKSAGQLYSVGNIYISDSHGGERINKLKFNGLIHMSNNEFQHKDFAKSDDKINAPFIKNPNSFTKIIQYKYELYWKALTNLILENSGAID